PALQGAWPTRSLPACEDVRIMPVRRRSSRLFPALLAASAVAGCTAGPSVRPAVIENDGPTKPAPSSSAPPAPLPPLSTPQSPTVRWSDCGAETRQRLGQPGVPDSLQLDCARLTVPPAAPDEVRPIPVP